MKSLCQNQKCYIKYEPISKDNESLEHIIPNALGGHLKSKNLVCSEINIGIFSKLDAELCKRIEIAKLIKFKRDDGKSQPEITGTSIDGLKYSINNEQEGRLLSLKPFEVVDKKGKRFLKFPAHQKDQIIAARLKKNPALTEKDIAIKIENQDCYNQMDFEYGLNIITASVDSFRAISKIATNFAILHNISRQDIKTFIDFIQGSGTDKIKLGYFYPKHLLNYNFDSDEVSHILYLKGSRKENLLYCYIELFNTHCFIVILNQNYTGEDVEYSYVWNVLKAYETNKPISLNLNRNYLLSRSYMYYDKVEKDYAEKLIRISRICRVRLVEKEA